MLAQVPGAAAEEAAEPGVAERMRPVGGGMILRPGDVLAISVQGEPELSGQAHIRPDGLIVLPLLGTVEAAGRTVTELADHLTELLRTYVVNPVVSVIQVGGIPRVVSVLGAVRSPGPYDVRQYERLLAVLAAAGGPTPDADLTRAVLVRDGEQAPIVREVIPGQPIIPQDIELQSGDAIFIPSLTERSVRVTGAVGEPGLVMVQEGLTASRAVLTAGGPAETADLTAVQVLRGTEQMFLNLRPLLQPERAVAGEEARDALLQADDVVIVPQAESIMVFVIGAVNAPGPQPAREARTASRAVVMAGGAAQNADLSRAYVLRGGEQTPLELTPLLAPESAPEGVQAVDASLRGGDVVVVPEQRPVMVVGAVVAPGPVSPQVAETVSRAIMLAGGPAEDADLSGAYILREGQQVPVNLMALLKEGDASADVRLMANDSLVIPHRPQVFHVAGQVMQPGTFPLAQAATVLDAWGLAGGPTLFADSSEVLLLRGESAEKINMDALVNAADLSQNRELQAGDTILVPKIEDEVYIFGAVARPGAHAIHEGDTIIDVLADAGGPSAGANIKRVAVIRRQVIAEARRAELYGRGERPERRPSRPMVGPPARGEEAREAPSDRIEKIAQQLAEGTEAISLFDLARVPEGDPRYLVHPGDVIYVPPLVAREEETRRVLLNIMSSLLVGALL
ncbi:MAG: SLBB domain-containing protein [Armatimonadota bacterium]